MTGAELDYFQLRFPRDLDPDAAISVLSAFSGMPSNARVTLDLSATEDGISHHLGVTQAHTDSITASLRAAVPSLHLSAAAAPARNPRRALIQASPRIASLRTGDLSAITASLLASLFPLRRGELVRLSWRLRGGARPAPAISGDSDLRGGRLSALRTKLELPGVAAYGELFITASGRRRRTQLFQRVAAVLRSLATPYGSLAIDPPWYGELARLCFQRGRYLSAPEVAAVIGWPVGKNLDLPGLNLGAAKHLVPSPSLADRGRALGTSDYVGLSRPIAISPAASTRGLWLLGPTGTGKTSLLKNLIRDDLEQGRGLAVLESNGDLVNDVLDLIPPRRLRDVVFLDPTDTEYAVGFNPFVGSADASLVADQLVELFERLWHAYWGPRTSQLAHMGLLTLARRKGSTLLDLPRLYLDPGFRAQVLQGVDDPVGLGPDWQWFEGLSVGERNTVIAPLLNKVRQFTARPTIRTMLGQPAPATSLRDIVAQGKILIVNLPKGLIGAETAQLLGCLVLTGLWQTAAGRAGLPPAQRRPFSLYVDEVQDFAAAPIPWDEMFAQGRKYGLALSVAHQNLGQLPKELRETILANARSKAVFALSADDAKKLEPLFAPYLTAADLQALDAFSVAALVALDNGATSRPVTLRTPPPPSPLGASAAVRASSRQAFAFPRAEVEASLRKQASGPKSTGAPIGRKKRGAR